MHGAKNPASLCTERKKSLSFCTERSEVAESLKITDKINFPVNQKDISFPLSCVGTIDSSERDYICIPTQERGNDRKNGGCAALIHPTNLTPFVIARRYDEAISIIQTNLLPRQNGVVRTLHPTNLILSVDALRLSTLPD